MIERRPRSVTRRLRHWLVAAMARAGIAGIGLLPRGGLRQVARALGRVGYWTARKPRRIAHANLQMAFGDTLTPAQRRQIICRSLENLAMTMGGLFRAPRLSRHTLEQIVRVDRDYLHELAQSERGVIFITPHYGDWEMVGLALSTIGPRMTVVAQQMSNPRIEQMLAELRGQFGNRLINQHNAALKLYRCLRRGEWTAALIDLNAPRRRGGGLWVDFFGRPVYHNAAIAWLAMQTGAHVVGGVAEPEADGRVNLRLDPIHYRTTGDVDADVAQLSRDCLAFCERVIRARPEHWLWTYKRWKHRPHPERGDYPAYSEYTPALVQDGRKCAATSFSIELEMNESAMASR